jgi:hypothetical protein
VWGGSGHVLVSLAFAFLYERWLQRRVQNPRLSLGLQ